jgi:hypothetical protein
MPARVIGVGEKKERVRKILEQRGDDRALRQAGKSVTCELRVDNQKPVLPPAVAMAVGEPTIWRLISFGNSSGSGLRAAS